MRNYIQKSKLFCCIKVSQLEHIIGMTEELHVFLQDCDNKHRVLIVICKVVIEKKYRVLTIVKMLSNLYFQHYRSYCLTFCMLSGLPGIKKSILYSIDVFFSTTNIQKMTSDNFISLNFLMSCFCVLFL